MTDTQLAANRANAQLSTGPRTEEGKKRSSLNAFRHGLTGQIVIHTPEDQAAFQKHCDAIRQELAPIGALENTLAQAIAEDYWRLNRARALENSIFTLGLQEHSDPEAANSEVDAALAQGRTWVEQARNLQLLTTYEQRIRRSVEKNMAELKALQAGRKAAVEQAGEEARLLVQLAEYEGRNFDPDNDLPPESQPLASFFRSPRSSAGSSATTASAAPVVSISTAISAPTIPNPVSPAKNALSAAQRSRRSASVVLASSSSGAAHRFLWAASCGSTALYRFRCGAGFSLRRIGNPPTSPRYQRPEPRTTLPHHPPPREQARLSGPSCYNRR